VISYSPPSKIGQDKRRTLAVIATHRQVRTYIPCLRRTKVNNQMDSSIAATAGILLGYISAEVATVAAFERLLWPQRFYYGYGGFQSMLKAILFMPFGGVLHKPTLQALDRLQRNGLLFQSKRGHMLGTPLYSDSGLKFNVPDDDLGLDVECRNGLLVSILQFCSRKFQAKPPPGYEPRAVQTVSLLTLTLTPTNQVQARKLKKMPLSKETGSLSFSCITIILASEIFPVVAGVILSVIYRNFYTILWFSPLVIKFISAFCRIQREPIRLHSKDDDLTDNLTLSMEHPTDGFIVIRGPRNIVLQFSRHYGHPIRNRTRELIQIFSIVALNLLFPIGMLCLFDMPPRMQSVWLLYQLYIALAMHAYRYFGGDICCSIQEAIGNALLTGNEICLEEQDDLSLLCQLNIIPVKRVAEGRAVMAKLIEERPV
jgi:hypothetical protein